MVPTPPMNFKYRRKFIGDPKLKNTNRTINEKKENKKLHDIVCTYSIASTMYKRVVCTIRSNMWIEWIISPTFDRYFNPFDRANDLQSSIVEFREIYTRDGQYIIKIVSAMQNETYSWNTVSICSLDERRNPRQVRRIGFVLSCVGIIDNW